MALSRKHYEAVAEILRNAYVDTREVGDIKGAEAATDITHDLATYFENDNSNFDRVRFLNAANPD